MTGDRIVTGAHYGARDWLAQRITAVVLLVYVVWIAIALIRIPELTYGTWAGLFASPWMRVPTLVAALALIYHTWVGMRDIYMDYLKHAGVRLFAQSATIVLLIGYAFWTVVILWRI